MLTRPPTLRRPFAATFRGGLCVVAGRAGAVRLRLIGIVITGVLLGTAGPRATG
jgi:hypothetical protein